MEVNFKYVSHMGSDLSIVNAARVSFHKESFQLTPADERLLVYLAQHGHKSPLRHAFLCLSVQELGIFPSFSTLLRTWQIWALEHHEGAGQTFIPQERGTFHWLASLQALVDFLKDRTFLSVDSLQQIQYYLGCTFPAITRAFLPEWTHPRGDTIPNPVPFHPPPLRPVLGNGYLRLVDFLPEVTPSVMTWEIKAPLMVRSQWFKYVRGGSVEVGVFVEEQGSGNGDEMGPQADWAYARNEVSRRYVTLEPEFYFPTSFREAPQNKKQGSGPPLAEGPNADVCKDLEELQKTCLRMYHSALEKGTAPEQARLFLPAFGLMTVWRWTCSRPAVEFFLSQRLGSDAQEEIRQYAQALQELLP